MKKFKNKRYLFSLNLSLFSMLFCVFFICILVFGVKKNFFFLESLYHSLNVVHKGESGGVFFKSYWTSVLLFKKSEKIYAVFDDGSYFKFGKDLEDYMKNRSKNIVYLSSLMMKNDQEISSLSVIVDNKISYEDLSLMMGVFSEFGYRNFKFNIY